MRKIKLMALLLAALMIVTAFAGCAGVKKEELDALDVRVQALEDLLNGQQKDLADIKSEIAGLDNKEVLDAIESIKTDLESQIKDVNTRVDDEIGKADTAAPAEVSAETKAEQQKALALIEVKRAEFSKASDEYSAEDYVKISEALGTATGAVNAATTVDAVKAAMTALDSELAKYMTYAMKAYDYYCKLLGNVNADAGDLVEEAKAFLKEAKAIYDETNVDFVGKLNGVSTSKVGNEYVAELAYLVSEGSTEARDEYIDIYNAINDLCTLYTSKNATKVIPYIEDGDIEFATLKTVKQYTDAAEDLVKSIKNDLGENLVYKQASYNNFSSLYTAYETFVEEASLLGGDKLVNLVTNAADIVAAEDAYKLIKEAAENYSKATRVSAGNYGDVFEYYTALGTASRLLETTKGTKTIWVADEYEKVEDILADWIAEYELSEDNVKAIIADKETTTFYNTYILDKHINDLLVEAFNNFKTEIADKIVAINDVDGPSIDLVIAYDEVEELINDFFLLQEKTTDKTVEYPANVEVTLKGLTTDDKANIEVILREADIFNKFTEERVATALNEIVFDKADGNGFITLYTFEADIDEIEADGTKKYFDATAAGVVTADNRKDGDIYKFLNTEYATIKTASKAINDKIEALVKKVDNKTIANNEEFITLEGLYIKIPTGKSFESGEKVFTSADDVYVLASDIYDTTATFDTFMAQYVGTTPAAPMTIEAFKYHNPEFVAMLDIDEFEAAKKTIADRMDTLFTDADAIVDLAEAIDYVRDANAVIYKDLNGNGKYDTDEEFVDGDNTKAKYNQTVLNHVSLNDKAAVDTAWVKYDAWVKLGGAINMAKFDNYVDADEEVYDDVFVMQALKNPTKVDSSIKLVRSLAFELDALATAAANFVATVENVKKVDAATAFVVTLDNNTLKNDGSNSVRFFAWTKFVAATNDDARDNDGTYTLVKDKEAWKTESYKTDCYDKNAGNTDLASKAMTKAALLGAVVTQYNDFVVANVEYLADAKNDYTDTEKDYYQLPDYVAYAAFDKAVEEYAKYDLLAVKGALLGTYDKDTNAQISSLRKQINAATTLADLESVLYAYVAEYADANAKESAIGQYTIYDFERLEALN